MSTTDSIRSSLVEVDDSVLVVIDIQDAFLNKYDNSTSQTLVAKASWVIQLAQHMGVPIVAMAEDIGSLGSLNQTILDALPDGLKIHDKDFFGLAGNPSILADVNATGRKTAVLIGTETDVCVAQSAVGLRQNGYNVVVLKDAVATTAGDEIIGLSRMHEAGVLVSSVKALHFEWQRSVTSCMKVRASSPALLRELRPDCLVL